MTRIPSTVRPGRTLRSQLILMATIGTLVPLAMLALLYALAPLPMTPAAVATLRACNAVAGVIIVINAVAVLTIGLVSRLLRRRTTDHGGWQTIRLGRASA